MVLLLATAGDKDQGSVLSNIQDLEESGSGGC